MTAPLSLKQSYKKTACAHPPSDTYTANSVTPLLKWDVSDALELIEKIRNSKLSNQSHHLKAKTFDELDTNLNSGFPLFGIRSPEGRLIAFAMLCPTADPTAIVMKSVCSDPAFSGRGLGASLLAAAEEWAKEHNYPYLIAKVALDNEKSLNLFKGQNFAPSLSAKDPQEGYPYCYMIKHAPLAPGYAGYVRIKHLPDKADRRMT